MNTNDYFHDADVPWMPKLVDIEWLASNSNPDVEERLYYTKFGWDELDHDPATAGHQSMYPNINARWSTLTTRFNERYFNRMLAYETMETWQTRLQNKFDEMAPRFERAYALYSMYDHDMKTKLVDGETETTNGTNQASGTDTTAMTGSQTNSTDNSTWDTPDSILNGNPSYADTRAKGTDTTTFDDRANATTYGRLDTANTSRTKINTGANILENVNVSIRDWKDIDTAFIAEFENLFLNVFWY